MAKSKAEWGRFLSPKKVEAILWVLRREEPDLVSRGPGTMAATLSALRDYYVTSGQGGLKSRAADEWNADLARLERGTHF